MPAFTQPFLTNFIRLKTNPVDSLKTILYFSIFKYPVTLDEIQRFSPGSDRTQIELELQQLIDRLVISKVGDYYFADCDPDCIERRIRGNTMAAGVMAKARERALLIARFPFVEAVGVSGSLSKGYYDANSDVDFFVITRPGKVWIARTLLMLYKKIFLLNSRKFFCINYFMSSSDLEVAEKNRFTATEIKTLIPIQGKSALNEFYLRNQWISGIIGSAATDLESVPDIRKPFASRIIETMFDNAIGNFADRNCRKLTVIFWKIKFRQMEKSDFSVALKSTKSVSKHHPLNFQKKVILALNEKYDELQSKHNITLAKEYV